jgi:hypothetical protein
MTSSLIIGAKMIDKFVLYLIVPLEVVEIFFSNTIVGVRVAESLRNAFIVYMGIWKESDLHKISCIFFSYV